MERKSLLSKEELAVWTWLVSKGINNAMSGLSAMIGTEVAVTALSVKQYPVDQATQLLGGPDTVLVGIYLSVEGDANGHLMLVHDPNVAFQLIDLQTGSNSEVSMAMGEMEKSVMAEMGNITGSYFLNALADATDMTLTHSPPEVLIDMSSAILGIALSQIMMESEEVLVVQTTFGTANKQIDGAFLVMPTMEFLRAVLKKSCFAGS